MRQKKKRSFLKRAAAGLLTFLLTVSLIQPYFVSAQEETTVTTESGEEGQDQGNESKPVESEEAASVASAGEQNTALNPAEISEPAARISFQAVRNSLEDVEVTLSIDGNEENIIYPAGLIEDNLDSLNLSENTVFQKAVVRLQDGSESEIVRVGKYNDEIYYSLGEQEDVGILLNEGASIVLLCASQYEVNYICTPENGGNYSGPEVLVKGNDLNVVINAAPLYHIEEITWECDDGTGGNGTITDLDSMTLNIPSSEIKDDITVNIRFGEDGTYRIFENEDPNNAENTGIHHGDLCLNDDAEVIPDVEAGGTSTFWMYSESNTGGSDFHLTQLTVNGEDVGFPEIAPNDDTDVEAVEPVATTLSNGTKITVKLLYVDHQIGWKGDDSFLPTNDKYRTIYEVKAEKVMSDLSFEGYFKQRDDREMLMIPKEGIASVGAVDEEIRGVALEGNHYYYTLQEDDGNTSYNAFFNEGRNIWGSLATAYNIYLYSVLPGYNPYTVDLKVSYDWIEQDNVDDLFETRMGDTSRRPWVTVDELEEILFTSDHRHYDGLLEAIQQAGYQYTFVLKQNESYNQRLELAAHPYLYNMVFDLGGGTYDGTGLDTSKYQVSDGKVTEKDENGDLLTYTLQNGDTFSNMPIAEPVKEGYVFAGWKLCQNGTPVNDTIYTSNQQFVIDSESIQYAEGDVYADEGHTFTFVAQWNDVKADPATAGITINYYKEDPQGDIVKDQKSYSKYRTTVDAGVVGDTAVILNENPPEGDYAVNEDISVRSVKLIDELDPSYEAGISNVLELFYDLSTYTLTVGKDVQEDGDLTRAYEIQISLNDTEGNPVSGKYGNVTFENGTATIKLKDGEKAELTDIPSGYQYSVEEIESLPNGYTTTYQTGDGEPSDKAPSDVALEGHTTVTVINSRTVTPDSGITLGGTAAGAGIGLAAVGAAVVFFLRRRKNA